MLNIYIDRCLYFFCASPTEKVLSSFSAATSDNICSKKRDVKNIFATQKVGLGKGVAYIYMYIHMFIVQSSDPRPMIFFPKLWLRWSGTTWDLCSPIW